jgi:hypothetical protein
MSLDKLNNGGRFIRRAMLAAFISALAGLSDSSVADAHKVKGCGHVHGPTTVGAYNVILAQSRYLKGKNCITRLKRSIPGARVILDRKAVNYAWRAWGVKLGSGAYYGRHCLPYLKSKGRRSGGSRVGGRWSCLNNTCSK